uniref:Uncharacterized protein n=1 Tax=Klebsiella variicola TaxID=244366 RepID=A0A1U9Y6D6_KLEVA|nr:hypothetical protein [Klebsiella variicola]
MLPSGIRIWQPEFPTKILSRKTGAVHLTLLDGMADHAVQRLDGVGGVDHFADILRVSEERGKVGPVGLPAPAYLWIPVVPRIDSI